jgi:hypothetical protein
MPAVRNFRPEEYRAAQQNFAVVQAPKGVLYVGNGDGVLEFDGVRWRLVQTPRKTAIRSLAVDSAGRVYIGAQGEIGYLYGSLWLGTALDGLVLITPQAGWSGGASLPAPEVARFVLSSRLSLSILVLASRCLL